MPTFYPIQTAFNAGEISPRMRGRVDSPMYRAGLGLCLNWEPLPQGSLRMRAGTEHVCALASTSPLARIISFPIAGRQDFVLELGNLFVKAYDASGLVTGAGADGGSANLVQNGSFSNGTAYWEIVTGPVSMPSYFGGCWLLDAGARVRQAMTTTATGVHTLKGTITTTLNLIDEALRIRVGTTPGGAELYEGEWGSSGGFAVPFSINVNVPVAGPIYLDFTSIGNSSSPQPHFDDVEFLAPGTASSGSVSLASPWTLEQLAQVQYAVETGADRMVFVHPNVAPWVLQRSAANVWTFAAAVFTGNVSPITLGEWVGAIWPSTVEIHNGRAYYGGAPNARNRVWATKSGTLFDFQREATPLPGDALDVKVLTKGTVRWLREGYALLVGTDTGAHMYTGSNGQPLNGDQFARRVPGVGSAAIQAVDTGESVLHVSSDRRRVNALNYSERTGWQSQDALFAAEHLTLSGVKELHHLFAPDGNIALLLDSGEIALCAYEPSREVVAWWRTQVASGTVRSAAVSRAPREGYLWLEVERSGVLYLERLPLTESVTPLRYLDASVTKIADANGSVAITHLTGTVRVRCGDEFVGDFEVAAGAIALGAEYANKGVVVGKAYVARAETLPLEGGNPAGTAQGRKRRFVEINLRLNDSIPPKVNGSRPSERSFGALNAEGLLPTVRITDDVLVKSNNGWSDNGVVVIEQDLPFRTEVCALYGQAKVNV
jgi:hypothetical protein